jgi:hypothetical protein
MPISDNKKIEILSNLVIRAGIYFDLFYVHESKKYREEYLNEMNKFPEYFRFSSHSYLFSMITYIAQIFDPHGNVGLNQHPR